MTETWLADGKTLEEDRQVLLLGAGVSMLCKNRKPDSRGLSDGGVTILYKEEIIKFKEVSFDNPEGHEVLAAIGSMQGHNRKLAVLACYLPPNLTSARASACLDYIEQLVIELKRRLKDPYICLLYTSPSPRDRQKSRMPSSA